eukprot:9682539-Lingulodinium_polyedra.AAC.1
MLSGESGPSGALSIGTGPSVPGCCLGGGFGGGAPRRGLRLMFLGRCFLGVRGQFPYALYHLPVVP